MRDDVHQNRKRGPNHYRWSDGRMISSNGYVKLRVGRHHPLADAAGYVYEHLVIWVSAGRERPADGFIIHHKNEVKTDNRLENLEIKSRYDHGVSHHATLTDQQVRDLRIAYADSRCNMPALAIQYGIPYQQVSKIIRGETRKAAGGPMTLRTTQR